MRNLKKFLALVLAMLMIVSASAVVSASDFTDVADDSIYAEAIADLVEKGITNGVAAGQFGPDQPVQRFQMALFMARALEPDVDDWMTGMQVFDDVNEWYGAIAYAYVNNIVTGMGNNLFAPHDGIRYQDALIMALRALGYKVDVSGDPYWLAAYNQAQALGLTKGVEVYVGEQVLTRAETAQIIYNMLYTTPADGGATIAAKNFGEATAANTTTMVVTATPKQAYAESYKAAEEGYLGLQTVVNGLPAGDVIYLPAAVLGVDADDVEAYFGYSFDFVNYDAENGSFDKVMIGEDPVVVYSTDVTVNSSEKITIDGTAYYTVDEFEGAALKNEIVVYNAGDLAYLQKVLYTDKDGNVVNSNGDIVARYSHKSSDGTKFYLDLAANVIITEEAALAKYGIDVADDSYIRYSTLSAKDLKDTIGNYQLTLFDDDRDGKFERAIVANVYMSAYKAKDSGGETFGPMNDVKDVVYTEDLTKGEVFVYTYNSQTKVVDVIDILDIQYGALTRIDTTKVADHIVKLTIDGEVYTVANSDIAKQIGATIYNYDAQGFDKITSDAQLGYADYKDLDIGAAIAFYEYNGYIINAKTYDIIENFERVVIDQIVSYDSENIYADMYIGGKLVSNVAISNVDGQKISSLNIFQLSRLLSDSSWETGHVFKAVKLSDGSYQVSEALVPTGEDNNLVDFKLVSENFGTVVTFDDGIADIYNSDNTIARDRVIRSNDSTVFYFLKKDAKGDIASIATYVGAPDNSSIDFTGDNKPSIYADKIGYGNKESYKDNEYNGVASFVLVYYTDSSDISGFGVANIEYSTVYVVNNADKVVSYEAASAEDLGLVGSEYVGKYFVRYSADGLAVDMSTGAKINDIYVEVGKKIEKDSFYVLSVDNVVLFNRTANITSDVLDRDSFVDARYWNITDVDGNTIANNNSKVSSVYLTADTAIDVKTAVKDVLDAGKEYTVKYVPDFTDGTFVGIVVKSEAPAPADGTANATWTWDAENATTKGAVADVKNDATATIQLYENNAGIGGSVSDKNDSDAAKGTSYDVDLWKWNGVGYQEKAYELNADATFVDGVLTITDLKSVDGIWDADIEAGRYKVDVTFTVTSGAMVTVTYYAVVK